MRTRKGKFISIGKILNRYRELIRNNKKRDSQAGFTPLEIRRQSRRQTPQGVLSLTGFTLVELLVSIGIFVVIFAAMMGTLIFGIRIQRRLLIEQQAVGELSYAIEYMSRALRLAIKEDGSFNCLPNDSSYQNPSGDPSRIRFINHLQGDDCQEFFLENNTLRYRKGIGVSEEIFDLTSPGITVTDAKFSLLGETSGDELQPRVSMILRISYPEGPSLINAETTVSQRRLDVN